MLLTAGTRLGVYEILAPLGAGGMGEVYRAQDSKLGRSVAVKILPHSLTSDPDRVARFDREARVLASLNHPNIAVLYGAEQSDGVHFLVMELVEGETLDFRLKAHRAGLSVDEALPIARQIADALEAAHEKGVVHRDLKPANIKITPDESIKVLDFGLAKATSAADVSTDGSAGLTHSPTLTFAGATQAGMILGTAPYMAPEQAKGRAADKRSDVWAFGCILYEMLAGRRAFEGDDVSDVLASVIKSDPDWTALPSTVPPTIVALIQGCLKKDRKERIGDISTALFLMNQPLALSADTSVGSTPSISLWRRGLPVVAGAAIGALAIVAIVSRPRPSPPPLPVTRFSIPLTQGGQIAIARQAVTISPDGQRIAYAANGRLYVRSMSESESRAVSGTETAATPEFSPDGQWLVAWYASDSTLKKTAVGGGTPTTICRVAPTPSGIRWDGDDILFAQAGAGIMRVSANGGKPDVVVPIDASAPIDSSDAGLPHGPQLLPGGGLLYSIAPRRENEIPWDQARVIVQSPTTGERRTIIEGAADARYVPTGHLVYAVSGTLFAVPFDVERLAINGAAVPIVEGVARVSSISSGSAQFAFSDSGAMVYLPGPVSSNRLEVLVFDRTGGATALKLPSGSYGYPRVSPDGKRIVFEARDDNKTNVMVFELSGTSAARRLTFDGNNRYPLWSGDGRRVAFQSDREGDFAVYWQPVDGGAAERLTKPEPGTVHVPESWSPTGDVLLFSIARKSGVSLWTFDVRERKATLFGGVNSSSFVTNAVFSPDGRWVAYQDGEQGAGEGITYVQPFPPNGTKYEIGRGGRPSWSRDGSELFYVPAPGQFGAVKVMTQPAFAVSNPTPVHRGFGVADPTRPRPYDPMPDGRFVGIGASTLAPDSASGPAQINVVLNWFTELNARVPAR